jgi:hypothetical protein
VYQKRVQCTASSPITHDTESKQSCSSRPTATGPKEQLQSAVLTQAQIMSHDDGRAWTLKEWHCCCLAEGVYKTTGAQVAECPRSASAFAKGLHFDRQRLQWWCWAFVLHAQSHSRQPGACGARQGARDSAICGPHWVRVIKLAPRIAWERSNAKPFWKSARAAPAPLPAAANPCRCLLSLLSTALPWLALHATARDCHCCHHHLHCACPFGLLRLPSRPVQAPAAAEVPNAPTSIATRLPHDNIASRMGAHTRNEDLIAPGAALSLHHPGPPEAQGRTRQSLRQAVHVLVRGDGDGERQMGRRAHGPAAAAPAV